MLFFVGLATQVAERAFGPLVGLAMRGQSPVYVRGEKIALLFLSGLEISTPGDLI